MNRMNREQFFANIAPLDEERLRKALWNLYWRGTAKMRERIEAELDPDPRPQRRDPKADHVDPDAVLAEVREFVALARSGAYMAGDRACVAEGTVAVAVHVPTAGRERAGRSA
ncbi:MAG TPA: hypothetical protein VK923_09240 [Euzebyales bacterium]|nr:hypothetical protein [Euzebyales bacterium]